MARLDAFFKLMFDSGASDLHITSGQPPILRVHGELERVKYDAVSLLAKVEVRTQEQIDREEAERRERLMRALQAQHIEAQSVLEPGAAPGGEAPAQSVAASGVGAAAIEAAPFVRSDRKVGRNELCPCGSGRKFKHCHGALSAEG